jgi:hypothetical protein
LTDNGNVVLPELVKVTQAFASRAPSQRVIDAITRIEGGTFGDIAQNMPFRLTAFRALSRDYPGYDATALWLHAYDCEVEITEVDPTNAGSPTAGPPSVSTSAAFPVTSTS